MHVAYGLDGGVAHRRRDNLGRLLDLPVAANLPPAKKSRVWAIPTLRRFSLGFSAGAIGTAPSRKKNGYVQKTTRPPCRPT